MEGQAPTWERTCNSGLVLAFELVLHCLGRWPEAPVLPALAKCHRVESLPAQPASLPAGWLGPGLSQKHFLCQ